MAKKTPEAEERIQKAEPVRTGDLDKAIKRIYKKYGGDLQAFFRDTQERQSESDTSKPDPVYCD